MSLSNKPNKIMCKSSFIFIFFFHKSPKTSLRYLRISKYTDKSATHGLEDSILLTLVNSPQINLYSV